MKYKKLSDCASFRNERTKQIDFETYISTENMLPNKAGITIAESLPDVKTTAKYLPKDILLSNIRPYFKKIWLSNREGGCSNDVLVVTAKSGYEPSYLYYVLSDNNFFNYDTVTAKGTKMPRGTPKAIMKYLVPDVDKKYQDKIVFILSKYDSLIENNNKRIEVLEQMAEHLYKEWFVRFRFPGYETAEFENGIPQGWSIKKLSEISTFTYGKMPDADRYIADGYEAPSKSTINRFRYGHAEELQELFNQFILELKECEETANRAFVEGFFYVDLIGCEGVKQRIHQIGLIAALAFADMIVDDRNHRTKIASLHVIHSKTVSFQSISVQCVFAPRDVE